MASSEDIVVLSLADDPEPPKVKASKKGKALIPWRKEPEGTILKEKLISMALYEKLHLKQEESEEIRWNAFIDVLFKQPEFESYEKVTWRSLERQFQSVLEDIGKKHGWMTLKGGKHCRTGNLSGDEGDLAPLDSNVKQILQEMEEEEEAQAEIKDAIDERRRETQAALRKECNRIEHIVIENGLNITRKRKPSDDNSPNDSSNTSRRSTPPNSMDNEFMGLLRSPLPDLNAGKDSFLQNKRAEVKSLEKKMLTKINELSVDEIIAKSNMNFRDDVSLHEIGIDIAVLTYYGDIKEGPQVNQFAAAMKECGMNNLNARKLFAYLRSVEEELDSNIH